MEKVRIEEYLHIIVKNTLLYGDYFAEIADPKTALTSRALITEAEDYFNYYENAVKTGIKEELKFEVPNAIGRGKSELKIVIDYETLEEKKKEIDPKNTTVDDYNNVKLVFHEPRRVLKLQSELFPICFGYLVFPKSAINPGAAMQDQPINAICSSIIRSISDKIPQVKELGNASAEELKSIIKAMLSSISQDSFVNIRYIAPDKMQHFTIPSTKFHPYGESIFDSMMYTAKVLIALETALAIQRLNRSTEKRKIAIEIGLPRDARKMVEQLKEEFKKRKVSLDSFGTVDTIPSMITTFEDVYIPQKDGKPFVDISTFTEGNVDIRSKVDELKFLRDQLVAAVGVPPAFIGIEENSVVKATLTEENVLFARTIISHQKYLTHQMHDLMEKIVTMVNPEDAITLFENISIAFPTPKSLQFEREARYMGEIVNLIENLERIGVPREFSKKKYLSGVDWGEVEEHEIEGKIDDELGKGEDDETGGIGGMGGGGGFGGAGGF